MSGRCRRVPSLPHKLHTEIISMYVKTENSKNAQPPMRRGNRMIILTNTGRRGWQARLTIGFLRSVFIFVGGLPPSTVPTTTREQKSLELVNTYRWTFKK
jgi:hypothetical protein